MQTNKMDTEVWNPTLQEVIANNPGILLKNIVFTRPYPKNHDPITIILPLQYSMDGQKVMVFNLDTNGIFYLDVQTRVSIQNYKFEYRRKV